MIVDTSSTRSILGSFALLDRRDRRRPRLRRAEHREGRAERPLHGRRGPARRRRRRRPRPGDRHRRGGADPHHQGARRERHALVRAQRRDPARRQHVAGLGARHPRPRRAVRRRRRRRRGRDAAHGDRDVAVGQVALPRPREARDLGPRVDLRRRDRHPHRHEGAHVGEGRRRPRAAHAAQARARRDGREAAEPLERRAHRLRGRHPREGREAAEDGAEHGRDGCRRLRRDEGQVASAPKSPTPPTTGGTE